MKNYARYFGVFGLIFFIFGSMAAVLTTGAGRTVGVAQALAGLAGMITFLFYFLGETASKISEKKEALFGLAGALFLLLFLIGANVIAHSKWGEKKFDLTTNKIHSLSPESRKILKDLKSPIRIYAFFSPGKREISLIQSLVEKYTYESSKISLTLVDPDKEPGLTKQLDSGPEEIVIRNEETKKQLKLTNLSEESLTIALRRVMSDKTKTAYFLQGHGEGELEGEKPNGLYVAKVLLENEGFTVKPLPLGATGEIPADAQVIAAWGAQRPLSKAETDQLERYLLKGGTVIVGQDPLLSATKDKLVSSGLEPLLALGGLEFKPAILLEKQLHLLRGQVINAKLPITRFGDHSIVGALGAQAVMEVSIAQPVAQLQGFKNDTVTRTVLLSSSEDSWAESDIGSFFVTQKPSLQNDQQGPVSLAQVAEIKIDEKISDRLSPSGKLIVFGDADFATNVLIQGGFNRDVFLNSFNYSTGEDLALSIRPKTWTSSTLELSPSIRSIVEFSSWAVIPQIIFIIAAMVWISRRRSV